MPAPDNSFPLVTIITPSYNRGEFLEETIRSVLSQNYSRIEYIVLDDGSTDDTPRLLRRYEGRIRWESHPNMGETLTVNKGFQMAAGDIICVVNSDDPLLPGAVSAAVGAFHEDPEALVVYSDWLEIGPKSEPVREHKLPLYEIHNMLVEFNVSMGPGTFFRRRAFDLIGFRDVRVRYTGDLDYWFRLALHGRFVHIPRALATHRTHPGAASSNSKGSRMAGELVHLALKVCSAPELPEDLRGARRRILANAHWVAAQYCESERSARWAHKAKWMSLGGWRKFARVTAARALGAVQRWTYAGIHLAAGISLAFIRLARLAGSAGRSILTARNRTLDRGRFLVVSHVLPPSWSGQAVILGRLLSGVDPRLYCVASISDYHRSFRADDQSERLPSRYYVIPPEVQLPGRGRFPWMGRLNTRGRVLQRAVSIAGIMRREKCSVVLAGTGDLIDPPAAYLAARLTGSEFHLHMFDDYTFQWIDPVVREQARGFQRRLVGGAAGIIVPNEFMAREVFRRHRRDALIVRNVCARRLTEMPAPDRVEPGDRGRVRDMMLLYTGAVYHVNVNTLRMVITALEHIESPGLRLHLFTAQPEEYLQSQGIGGSRVVHHPHAPYEEVEQVQRTADILLIPFDFDSPAAEVIRTAAPGKLGDYLSSGTPILAVVPGDTFVAWYLRRYDCGLVVDRADTDAVAARYDGCFGTRNFATGS